MRWQLALLIGAEVVVLVPLGWLAWRSLRETRHWLRLALACRRTRRFGFDAIAPGPVALRGKALAIDLLTSAETGREGIFLGFSADRWDRSGMGGLSGHWVREEEDEEAAPFELSDGTATVLVDPAGARAMRVPVVERELAQPDGALIRYREQLIGEGEELLVVGEARAIGGFSPSEAYRGHGYRVVVRSGRDGLTLALPGGLGAALAIGTLGRAAGVLPALCAIALLLATLLG
jgi:hypothetical protein